MRFDVLEPPQTGAYCTLHTLHPLKRCSWRRFGPVEPPRTRVKEVYIPCHLCEDVVREGSMRFDVLEPHRTGAYCTLYSYISCKDVVREDSVQSNHPELV